MLAKKFALKKLAQINPQQGITLTETLVAIVILTIFLVASTPPLLIAMNNRIQTRRAKQALDLGQQEIERVRLLVENGKYVNNDLPANSGVTSPKTIFAFAAPTVFCGGPGDGACPTTVPSNMGRANNASGDFYVQTFRDTGILQDGRVVVFRMGVRVYSRLARPNLGNLKNTAKTPSLTIGSGTGVGNQRYYPLAVFYSDFSNDDLTNRLNQQRQFSNMLK